MADFIFMKTLYSNSCLYNRSYSNLSRKTGFSRTKITKLIKTFTERGWVRQHANNIVLAWDKTKYKAFTIIKFITPNDILNQLHLFLLKSKQQQCMYANRLRKDLKLMRFVPKHRFKRMLKQDSKKKYSGAICDRFVMSSNSAGKLFKCKAANGNRILLTLERAGLIFINRHRKCFVKRCSKQHFEYFSPPKKAIGSFYWFKGGIYNSPPNTITIANQSSIKGLMTEKQHKQISELLRQVSNLRKLVAM